MNGMKKITKYYLLYLMSKGIFGGTYEDDGDDGFEPDDNDIDNDDADEKDIFSAIGTFFAGANNDKDDTDNYVDCCDIGYLYYDDNSIDHWAKKKMQARKNQRKLVSDRKTDENKISRTVNNRPTKSQLMQKRAKAAILKGKRIKVNLDCDALSKKTYQRIYRAFEDEGFTNIRLQPIEDVYNGSESREGEIEFISIDGKKQFTYSDEFAYDSEIIIACHLKKEIRVPYSESELCKMNYREVVEIFEKLEFERIREIQIKDIFLGLISKEGEVERVTIGGKAEFKKNTVFKFDEDVVIEYHVKRKLF